MYPWVVRGPGDREGASPQPEGPARGEASPSAAESSGPAAGLLELVRAVEAVSSAQLLAGSAPPPAADDRPGSPSAAQVLALQRAVGNAATTQMLRRPAAGPAGARRRLARDPLHPPAPAPTDDDTGDGDENAEWLIPPNASASKLVGILHELREQNAKHLKQPELMKQTAYLVLGGTLLHYGPEGQQIASYQLKDGITTVPPGYWAGSVQENIWRRLSHRTKPPGPWGFHVWNFPSARTPLQEWMTDVDSKRFQNNLVSGNTPAIMLAVPPGGTGKGGAGAGAGDKAPTPAWASDQASKAQKLANEARKAASGGQPPDKTKPVTDPALKKLPDRLVPWTRGDHTYVNVWADGAVVAIEARPDETAEQLLDRAKDAAQKLRDSRDPANSVGVANPAKEGIEKTPGAKPPPGNYREDYDPDPNRPPMPNKGANLPPYPATVTMAGADPQKPEEAITVPGASNQFKMTMDWSRGGRDTNLLSLVTAQMQYIAYRWELIKVTPGDYARQAAEARRQQTQDQIKEAAKTEGGKGEDTMKTLGPFGISSGEAADLSRAFKNIGEDTRADLDDMSQMPWALRSQYLNVIAISVAVRSIGALISEFTTRITMPLDERRISFGGPGDYVVRCIATPLHEDDAPYVRASSVASYAVRVETVRDRAHLADEENDRELAALAEQLKNPPKGKTVDDIKAAIEERKRQASSSHLQNTEHYLTQAQADLKLAEDLSADVQAGRKGPLIGRDPYSVKKRWLAVELAQQHVELDDYLEQNRKLVTALKDTKERLEGYGLEGIKGSAYSPRVTLASEENGQTYQLLTVLGQTKTKEDDGVVEYRLADVTSKNHQQQYRGSSTAAGPAGHQEAIRNAFVNFRENNGYGRGTIVIRFPAELENDPNIGPLPMEREMRSAPGEHARAMQKLKDVATAAAVAGLVVGGPVGMAIGVVGGVTGLVLTVEGIRERVSGGRFELLSFDTLMDVITIVGSTVGIGGSISGAARAAGSTARWAVTAEKLFVPMMKGGLILQVAVLPATAFIQLSKLDDEIKNAKPPMTEGEIALRRAEIATSFAWGAFTTSVSAAQMMGMPTLLGHETTTTVHPEGPPLDEPLPGPGMDRPPPHPDHGPPAGPHSDQVTPPDHPAPDPTAPHDNVPPEHLPGTDKPGQTSEPGKSPEPSPATVAGGQAPDEIVAETSLVNAHKEPHEIHRSRDGTIRRCSDVCMIQSDNVRERARRIEAAVPENSPRGREAGDIVRRADRLQERSRQAAELQTKKEEYIKTLKPGSAKRAISEQALAKWQAERNRVFNDEAAAIEQALSGLEERTRVGLHETSYWPTRPPAETTAQLVANFTDVAGDPAYREELDAIAALEGDPANAAEVRTRLEALADRMRAQVEANIQTQVDRARAALGRVGVGATGPEGGCLARSGDLATAAESGWADLNSPGITQATDQVLAIGQQMGYEFPPHEFDDTPGHFYASHAEKQLNALRPGEPIGVSLPMCSDCYNYFRARANAMGRPLVVADPLVTRIFHPNGSVLTPARTVAPAATGPANQSPGPPSGPR